MILDEAGRGRPREKVGIIQHLDEIVGTVVDRMQGIEIGILQNPVLHVGVTDRKQPVEHCEGLVEVSGAGLTPGDLVVVGASGPSPATPIPSGAPS